MNILCTGCAGFIGSWICEALLKEGHRVIGVDDLSTGSVKNIAHLKPDIPRISNSYSPNFRFLEIDLRSEYHVKNLFGGYDNIDVVYHLAANAREGASFYQPRSVVSRNTGAYINVLTEAIKHSVKKVILFSSIAVYGKNDVPYTEDMMPMPVDIYGLEKYKMERITQMLAEVHGFEYVIFRPHNVFGPRQALNDIHRNVFGIWMNQAMRGEPMTVYGNGMQQRAFSPIEHSLQCYVKAMHVKGNHIFNIGSDKPITIDLAQEAVWRAMGLSSDYPIKQLPDRHNEVKSAYSDVSKAKKELGLIRTEFEDFVNRINLMATWAKEQGPQEWSSGDPIELPTNKMPEIWK